MKKNNGFTIIELLTVIVLLSIIATITYVSIGSGMGKSKEKLYKQQIVTLENAGRNWVVKNSGLVDISYDETECKDNTCFTNNGKHYYKLSYYQLFKDGYIKSKDLKNPKNGERMPGCIGIRYNNEINQYEVNYIEECVNLASETDDTQKSYGKSVRVVYMDPTNLYNKCDSKEEAKNRNANGTPTEIKSGCMKWYAYYDDGKNTKMILDHNTTARLSIASTNSTTDATDAIDEINKRLKYDTVSWIKTENNEYDANKITSISVISAEEIAAIVGYNNWNNASDFYLSTKTTVGPTNFTATVTSDYAWLYNNLYKCNTYGTNYYGCTIEDNTLSSARFPMKYNTCRLANQTRDIPIDTDYDCNISTTSNSVVGYFTSTYSTLVPNGWYCINMNGQIKNIIHDLDYTSIRPGIRPVVTVPSSMIN